MTERLTTALRVIRVVAERVDPTLAIAVGAIAQELGCTLSTTSRLCSELEAAGYLERGDGYGAYRIGRRAIRLSGSASAPFARSVRYALTLAAQQTGETVSLAAGDEKAMTIVASVASAWTLHSPAEVGEVITGTGSSILRARALHGKGSDGDDAGDIPFVESTVGMSVEVAAPVLSPAGDCVAVVAVRLPANRAEQNLARSKRAVVAARRSIERTLEEWLNEPGQTPTAVASGETVSALDATFRILEHLAAGHDSIAGTARAAGLRPDRTTRLIESCRRAGFVWASHDRSRFHVSWLVHGWYRAAAAPTMVERAKPLVAEASNATRTCGFITILKGMRSYTLVEELEMAGAGLWMAPWLGRPHPIIGSDGGPTLVMDLTADELRLLFPARHTPQELEVFLKRVRRVVRDGVLSMEAFDGGGMISISAPVRDASGTVVAAACLVGTTDYMQANSVAFENETRELAVRVSALLS